VTSKNYSYYVVDVLDDDGTLRRVSGRSQGGFEFLHTAEICAQHFGEGRCYRISRIDRIERETIVKEVDGTTTAR
jgi:hypothetical protein